MRENSNCLPLYVNNRIFTRMSQDNKNRAILYKFISEENLWSHDTYNKSPIQRIEGGGIGTTSSIQSIVHSRVHNVSANLGRNRCSLSPKAFTDCPRIIDIPFSYRVINHFPSVTDTPPSVTGNHKEPQRLTNPVSKYLYTTVEQPVLLPFLEARV